MEKMKKYKSVYKEAKTLEFKSYGDFLEWQADYKGKITDKMKIEVSNRHGDIIIYSSPLDVMHSHEE